MKSPGLKFGVGTLSFLAACALFAPWLKLRDPAAQPDGLALRGLPPLSHVEEIHLKGDRIQLANEVRVLRDGGVEYRRGDRWARLEARELAGATPAEWHRLAFRRCRCCLRDWEHTRPPRTSTFRGSIPHPAWPLSTLQTPRCRDARKTRSRPARYGFDRMRLPLTGIHQLCMTYPRDVV